MANTNTVTGVGFYQEILAIEVYMKQVPKDEYLAAMDGYWHSVTAHMVTVCEPPVMIFHVPGEVNRIAAKIVHDYNLITGIPRPEYWIEPDIINTLEKRKT